MSGSFHKKSVDGNFLMLKTVGNSYPDMWAEPYKFCAVFNYYAFYLANTNLVTNTIIILDEQN